MKIREYSGPLTVFMMGILGFSLFCLVSAVALAGANEAHPVSIGPQNIVDSAFSNISTIAALTVEVITQYVSTSTPSPTDTLAFSPTSSLLSTPTRFIPFPSRVPTRTRRSDSTLGPAPTSTRVPSSTPHPTATQTPEPTDTLTPANTPTPADTATPADTPTPADTATPADTPPPADTATPADTPPPVDTTTDLPVVGP